MLTFAGLFAWQLLETRTPRLLYVVDAKMTIANYSTDRWEIGIRQEDVNKIVAFTDAPFRWSATFTTVEEAAAAFNAAHGQDTAFLLHKNAVLRFDTVATYAVEIMSTRRVNDTIDVIVKSLDATPLKECHDCECVLFIDDSGTTEVPCPGAGNYVTCAGRLNCKLDCPIPPPAPACGPNNKWYEDGVNTGAMCRGCDTSKDWCYYDGIVIGSCANGGPGSGC